MAAPKTEYCVFWIPAMAQDSVDVLDKGPLSMRIPGDRINSFYHLHSSIEKDNKDKPIVKVEIIRYRYRNLKKSIFERLVVSDIKHPFEKVPEHRFQIYKSENYPVYSKADVGSFSQVLKSLKEIRDRCIRRYFLHKSLSCVVSFSLEDYLPCGLAKFKLSECINPLVYGEMREMVPRQIMRHFHRHHFHSEYECVYTPYFSEVDVDIHADGNEPLLKLLEELKADMSGKVDGLYADYESIDNRLDRKERRERIGRRGRKKKKRQFYENCHNMAGQLVYIKALTDSRHNTCCRKGAMVEEKEKYSAFSSVFENISAGTEALRSKIRYHHDSVDLQKAAIISYISLAVGIISLIVALITIDWNRVGGKLGLIDDSETTCICDAAAFHAEMRSYAEF